MLFDPVFLIRRREEDSFEAVSEEVYDDLSLVLTHDRAEFVQYTRTAEGRICFAMRPVEGVCLYIREICDGQEKYTLLGDDNGGYKGYLFPCTGRIRGSSDLEERISSVTGEITFAARDGSGMEERFVLNIYPPVDEDKYLQMVTDILRFNRSLLMKASDVKTSSRLYEADDLTETVNEFCEAVRAADGAAHTEIEQHEVRLPARKIRRFNVRTVSDLNMGKDLIRTPGYSDSYNNYENRMILLYIRLFQMLCDEVRGPQVISAEEDPEVMSRREEILKSWNAFRSSEEYEKLMNSDPAEDDLICYRYKRTEKRKGWGHCFFIGDVCADGEEHKNIYISGEYSYRFCLYMINRWSLHRYGQLRVSDWEDADGLWFCYDRKSFYENPFKTCCFNDICKIRIMSGSDCLDEITLKDYLNEYEKITLESDTGYQEALMNAVYRAQKSTADDMRNKLREKLASLEKLGMFRGVPLRSDSLRPTNVFLYNSLYRRCYDVMQTIDNDLIRNLCAGFMGKESFPVGKCTDIYEIWCLIKILDTLINRYGFELDGGKTLAGKIEETLRYGDTLKDTRFDLTNSTIDPRHIYITVDYNRPLHSTKNDETKRPDIRMRIRRGEQAVNIVFDAKFRSRSYSHWFEDIRDVAFGKYFEWTDLNLEPYDRTDGSYILHSNAGAALYPGFGNLTRKRAEYLSQEQKDFLKGHKFIGSIPLLPADEGRYDNMCLTFRMIMEYWFDLADYCWICGSADVSQRPNNSGAGTHMRCSRCGEFWVKTHCSGERCRQKLYKHYRNFLRNKGPWNVICPGCGGYLRD